MLQAYDHLKDERLLLGLGIITLTLIVAVLMARTLPMRRDVEDPAALAVPQGYHENHANPEATSETAEGHENEPSGAGSGAAPEEKAVPEPTGSPAAEAGGTVGEAKDAAPAAAFARGQEDFGQERLRRIRRLRRIHQRRSPSSRRGDPRW